MLDNGRRVYRTAETRTELKAALDKVKRDHENGESSRATEAQRITVSAMLDRWLVAEKAEVRANPEAPGKSPNTYEGKRSMVAKHLKGQLSKLKLHELRVSDVNELLAKKAASGLSRSTVARIRLTLGEAISWAEANDLVSDNKARRSSVPETARKAKRLRALTIDEAHALITATKGERLEAVFVVMLNLGLRPGEATGLRWGDLTLDGDEPSLHVARSLKRETVDGRQVLRTGPVKTTKSARTPGLLPHLVEALKAHQGRQLEAGLAVTRDAYVFTSSDGGPIDPANLRRDFARITKAAGLGKWTPYELRSSAATILLDAGASASEIADVLGHESTTMLDAHYDARRESRVITAGLDVLEGLRLG